MGGSTNTQAKNLLWVERVLKERKWTPTRLSRELGMSNSVVRKWVQEGAAPNWAVPACRFFLRKRSSEAMGVLVVKVPAHQKEPLLQVISAFGGTAKEL